MSFEDDVKNNIKNNLVAMRTKCDMKQNDIALALNLNDASTYRSWETGRSSPKPAMLLKIAKIYNVSVEEIMGFEPPKTPIANLKVSSPSKYNENVYGDSRLTELRNDEKIFVMKLRQLNMDDKTKVAEFLEEILPKDNK